MNQAKKLAQEVVNLLTGRMLGIPDTATGGVARAAETVLLSWLGDGTSGAAALASVRSGGALPEDRTRLAYLLQERAERDSEFQEVLASLVRNSRRYVNSVPDAVERAAAAIDVTALVAALGDRKAEYLRVVRSEVEGALKAMTPAQAWSIALTDAEGTRRILEPQAKTAYAGALLAMTRDRTYRDFKAESAVTEVVLNAVEKATVAFYRDPVTEKMIGEELARQLSGLAAAGAAVSSEAKAIVALLAGEMRNAAVTAPIKAVAIDRVADVLVAFLASATGHELLVVLGKVMATHVGHAVIVYVATATAKVVSLSVMKGAVMLAVKKIGIAVLLKTTIGKVIIGIVLMALNIRPSERDIEAATLLILAAALPLIAVHEYRKLPRKLSDALPDKVVDILSGEYDNLNRSTAEQLVRPLLESIMWRILGGHLDWTRPLIGT